MTTGLQQMQLGPKRVQANLVVHRLAARVSSFFRPLPLSLYRLASIGSRCSWHRRPERTAFVGGEQVVGDRPAALINLARGVVHEPVFEVVKWFPRRSIVRREVVFHIDRVEQPEGPSGPSGARSTRGWTARAAHRRALPLGVRSSHRRRGHVLAERQLFMRKRPARASMSFSQEFSAREEGRTR